MDDTSLKDIRERYGRLYSGAVADMLDKKGFRNQILPYYITPFTQADRVCGFAFTGQGYPCAATTDDDTNERLAMLDIWACGGHLESAHWGEIMSVAAHQRGCLGAVVDGGVRDVPYIDEMKFPVFAKFKCAASSIGRWNIREWQVPVRVGNTVIYPSDFVFCDTDGVVVVPKDMITEVLVDAEDVFTREGGMRRELRQGLSMKAAYEKYGAF